MTVIREQVLAYLYQDEPHYAEAAQLGAEVLPHLRQLVDEGDPELASKATALASIINTDRSVEIVDVARRSPDPVVRVAAAVSLSNLSGVPAPLAESMLKDEDVGVRKLTLEALENQKPFGLKSKVQEVAKNDPNEVLREIAGRVAKQLP